MITLWPGGESAPNSQEAKTPTKIAYRKDNRKIRKFPADKFGYEVGPAHVQNAYFKLLLDEGSSASRYDDLTLAQQDKSLGTLTLSKGKSAKDVTTDYLRLIYNFLHCTLVEIFGKPFVKNARMEIWLTVPAIWSDKAKAITRQAAIQAGFGSRPNDSVYMISEPEAAFVATLHQYTLNGNDAQLKNGSIALVIDCGGGTVDLTGYGITFPKSGLTEFKEIVPGLGGKCGGTHVDTQFDHWMRMTFGKAFTSLSIEERGPGSELMNGFERAKRFFCGTQDIHANKKTSSAADPDTKIDPKLEPTDTRDEKPSSVDKKLVIENDSEPDGEGGDIDDEEEEPFRRLLFPMTGAKENKHYESNCITLFEKDMELFFEPAVQKVLQLCEAQSKSIQKALGDGRKIDVALLVGGFGASPYLYKRVKSWCDDNGVELYRPANA